ncbi:hypothetical protein BEWA_003690 [Theileria equi strain WA]|uniref:Uncharacterized protein n=1 Tax=Theileria equi strain WA TaxID=1537102 RepID=L0B153_THEEQ|nr:hypothetical protein BEWA_003690 [Theileria equi strain WA]AFZ80961.1 hypothetical protein BEWA_003690 [Theileria equi strain WA]|eukprot:XP_004830627.1 hypothetical protein BEWA_003690 [Theileria equi strain WA]
MSAEQTPTCIRGRYVDIDISKTEGNGSYTDSCQNHINFHKDDNKPKGYKKYAHTPRTGYYIGNISYNSNKQDGFPLNPGVSYYNKNVVVYYLRYDDDNVLPLLVVITKNQKSYEYYKKDDYFLTSNQWTREVGIRNDSKLSTAFSGIGKSLTTVIVLKIDQVTNGNYRANGTEKPPEANKDTQITVEGSAYKDVYKKYKHTPSGGINSLRILSTKKGVTSIPFDPPVYGTEYSEAHVYYWNGDSSHKNPLLLELKQTTSSYSYYTLSSISTTDKKWKPKSDIETSNIKDKLDRLNCENNGAHVIDISKKDTSGSYQCLTTGCTVSITFVNHPYTYYSRTLHSVFDDSIRRFKDEGTEQTGINSPEGTNQVYVFHYPKGPHGIPLLIYLPDSDKWYQRESLTSTKWTEVSDKKPGNAFSGNDPKIPRLLRDILPTVTINVGDTKVGGDGQSTTYDDTSGGITEKITLTRHDVKVSNEKTGYTNFTHCVQGKPYFMAGDIKYNTSLSGIPLSFILKSVIAYYSGKGPELKVDDLSLDDLLMVGLEKRGSDQNDYVYYGRRNGGSNWIVVSEKTKLESTSLTAKLKELKDEFAKKLTEKKKLPQSKANGLSGGEIAAISVPTVLTGGGLVGITIWKWPDIMSSLITRL